MLGICLGRQGNQKYVKFNKRGNDYGDAGGNWTAEYNCDKNPKP
jgi:hypothetical protein